MQHQGLEKAHIVWKGTELHRVWEIGLVFLRLGLTSFGGPVAHLSYFHEAFVTRRRWVTEARYAELVALSQFLPGPASSQVGMSIGLLQAGIPGALAAWVGFTLPSAVAMTVFALSLSRWGSAWPRGSLRALETAALAVVAQAVWVMTQKLCPDAARKLIAMMAACAMIAWPGTWGQAGVLTGAAVLGSLFYRPVQQSAFDETIPSFLNRRMGLVLLGSFFALLAGLPVLARLSGWPVLAMAASFYRTGALVFGGGHVVLPLLQAAVVPNGWVSNDRFLAGYGAAQALPGPLFTFAAFLGASMNIGPGGWMGALICVTAIFFPSFLLVAGALPFWDDWRRNRWMQGLLAGMNAGVVGLLLAALYRPIGISALRSWGDVVIAMTALMALVFWKWPPWLVVIGCGLAGWSMSAVLQGAVTGAVLQGGVM